MTAAIAILVLLAAIIVPWMLGVTQLIIHVAFRLATAACHVLKILFELGSCVVALILWGAWLCVDRRGALDAYRAYPKVIGHRDEAAQTMPGHH